MQPFDGGVFDKRYEDIFAPAIKDSGFEPYRVDKDPSVSIPINEIETGIKNSDVCFAEITTNNPNVWFELGYAIAIHKDVVLVVCSNERKDKYPFDIQHRSIIEYKSESKSDYVELKEKIMNRIKAISQENDVKRDLKPQTIYCELIRLLKEKAVDAADRETIRIIRETCGYTYIDSEKKANSIPDEVLITLDNIWGLATSEKLIKKKWIDSVSELTDFSGFFSVTTHIGKRLKALGRG
jgi:nucleoside 2-deoxyribosyltransferase